MLPSPNGSALSLTSGNANTVCGSLRNAAAVVEYAMQKGKKIVLIPAGEHWPDGSMRFALEDMLGAGAIISHLRGSLSPGSKAALSVYDDCPNIYGQIKECPSGKELTEKGFDEDIRLACQLNVSRNVPRMRDGAYAGLTL